MQIVVDASAVVTLALSDSGLACLTRHRVCAPRLLRVEAMSVIHEGLWRREVSVDIAERARDRVLAAPVDFVEDVRLYRGGWAAAERLGWAKTYDALYVALAERTGAALVTEDARLRRRLTGYLDVRGIADL